MVQCPSFVGAEVHLAVVEQRIVLVLVAVLWTTVIAIAYSVLVFCPTARASSLEAHFDYNADLRFLQMPA